MRRQLKFTKRMAACLVLGFLFLSCADYSFAATGTSAKTITPKEIREWDDGALVTSNTSGEGADFTVSVSADTNGLAEGHYSVYIYDSTERSIKTYDGMQFHFKNNNDIELKINLTFMADAKTSISLTDASFVILESDNQGISESVSPSYGSIMIPADFDGTIYVPFSQLHPPDGQGVLLSKIQSWGITAVMPQDQTIHYTIGNITFFTDSVAAMKNSYYFITITGSSEINLPSVGAVTKPYQAKVTDLDGNAVNQNVTFYLGDKITGAGISENGLLEITSDCPASEIIVHAKVENSVNTGVFTAALVRDRDGSVDKTIPDPLDQPGIELPVYKELNKFVVLIRVAFIIIGMILASVFTNWFGSANAYYRAIRKKLYETADEDDD